MISALEERLIGSGLVTADQLARAHAEARVRNKSFWSLLVHLGFLQEADLARFLARQLRVPFITLDDYTLDQRVLEIVDEELARRHLLLPMFVVEETLFVAMANPGNVVALDEVRARIHLSVEPLMTTPTALRQALDQYYGFEDVFGTTLEYVQPNPSSSKVASLTSADTRQHRRVAVRLPVQVVIATAGVRLRAGQPIAGELLDLSCSGALIEIPWFLPSGTTVHLQLQLGQPGQSTVAASGHVMHCQARVLTYHDQQPERQRIGLQFVDLNPATEAAIARLIDATPA